MKKKHLIILLKVLVLAAAMGFSLASNAAANGNEVDSIIYPTGLFPDDAQNVQAAVDAGGTILLKATDAGGNPLAFNFGPNQPPIIGNYVLLTNDVAIQGETTDLARTTIRGGYPPFIGFAQVESSIRGIHFDAPGIAALFLGGSTGAEFSDNLVTDVLGLPNYFGLGFRKGQAVWVAAFVPSFVSGKLLIANNVVDGIDAELGYGIALLGFSAETHVVGNEFRGANSAGIYVGDHTNQVWVKDNLVVPGPERFPDPPGFFLAIGNGIQINGSLLGGSAYVQGNTVLCENPWADGILFTGIETLGLVNSNSVISNNQVEMVDSDFGAISLYGSVENAYVGQNQALGSGAFALQVGHGIFSQDLAMRNSFIGNNISAFNSDLADVFFDVNSRSTALVGQSGTVIDMGLDNQITGFSALSPGLGQQIQSAQEVKIQSLQGLDQAGSEPNPSLYP